jgi:hypothetical protein
VVVVQHKHEYNENPDAVRFHKFGFDNGASITVCDMHRIANVRAMEYIIGDAIGDNTITSIDIHGGVNRSYDLLTNDAGYRINGIPVNSMIEELAAFANEINQGVL